MANESMSTRDLLGIRDFRLLWWGQIVSNFGDALTQLTLVLYINRVTGGSAQAIAWLLIALTLPMATLGLVAGVFVDRWQRRRVMILSDLLRALLTLGFVAAASYNLLWLVYSLAFLHSAISSFFAPARSAVVPRVVPREALLAANSLSQMSLVLSRLLGASIAGLLVGTLNTFQAAFFVDAATFILSAWLISRLALATRERQEATQVRVSVILQEMILGMKIIVSTRVLVGLLVAMAVTMLGIGGLNVLLTPMIVNELGLSETWYGGVNAAQTAGMIISGALITLLAARFKASDIVSVTLVILGIGVTLFYAIHQIWHIFPILFAIGLAITPLQASITTIMQTAVSNEILGRVSSALNAVFQTSSLISMFFAGAVAAWIGVRNVFVISGSTIIVAGLTSAWIFHGFQAGEAQATPAEPT